MRRNAGDYVKSWGAALIRGAATNPEFTVIGFCSIVFLYRVYCMHGIKRCR